MGTIGAIRHPHASTTASRGKQTFTQAARWTLYLAGALAIILGIAVWPADVARASQIHALTGWLTIVALWTLSAIAWRSNVSRAAVWFGIGWGLVTALGASAQYQLPAGGWITLLHVATGIGAITIGGTLLTRIAAGRELVRRDGLPIEAAAAEFLANKRIAVTGVSRKPTDHGSNVVYRRLRERGYEVFAINPNATEVEGDPCYPDLKSVPGGVEAVVIATRPDRALDTMRECVELGIRHVWMHRAMGAGSVSEGAAAWGRQQKLRVIAGGCPLMFGPTADRGHKLMRPLLTLTGKVPRHA